MSKHRPIHITAKHPPGAHTPGSPPASRPAEAELALSPWARFWFAPIDPVGLHRLRVLAGLLFLAWLLPLAGQVEAFFGLGGWFDLQAYFEAVGVPGGPPAPIGWSILYLGGADPTALAAIYWLSLGVVVLFTCGLWPRVTSLLTWVVVASFLANPATSYDAEYLLPILAFYLMVGYLLLGQRAEGQPLSWRLLGPGGVWPFGRSQAGVTVPRESAGANVALRLLQVHFAVVMVTSGLHKLQYGDWWAGLALWYPLHPPFETTNASVRVLKDHALTYALVLSAAAYAGLAWQLCFPLFAWRPRRWARVLLLGGAVVGWLSMAFIYQLPLFGPAVMVFCLGYLTPAEWRLLALPGAWGKRLPGRTAQTAAPRVDVKPAPAVPSVHVRQP